MFTIPRGTTRSYTVVVLDEAGDPVSLVGARIYFTVRVADVVVLAKANTAGGGSDAQIEVTAAGTFKIKILSADSAVEPLHGTCDAFVITATGDYLQPVPVQPFQITQAMTRAFPTP